MKTRTMLALTAGLLAFVIISTGLSQVTWLIKENNPDALRQIVGLPSVAVGNLNPSARNPGLELMCTGLYDTPGGYCYYFSSGISFINFTMASNITVIGDYGGSGG